MKTIFTIVLLLMASNVVAAMNTYQHRSICYNNRACMAEQAKAYSLWTNQSWDDDLKKSCKIQYISQYSKDYIGAVNCVYPLQVSRQEYLARQAQIAKDKAEAQYYREGGHRRIRP